MTMLPHVRAEIYYRAVFPRDNWLYSRLSGGEVLLYRQLSGGTSYYIAKLIGDILLWGIMRSTTVPQTTADFTSRVTKSYVPFTCKFPMVIHFVPILHRHCRSKTNFHVFSYDKISLKFCLSFRFSLQYSLRNSQKSIIWAMWEEEVWIFLGHLVTFAFYKSYGLPGPLHYSNWTFFPTFAKLY